MAGAQWLSSRGAYAVGSDTVAFEKVLKRRNELQDEVYYDLKASFDLSARPAVRVVKKVVDAYATMAGNIKAGNLTGKARRTAESRPVSFREDAAQPFDDRCLTWNLDGSLRAVPGSEDEPCFRKEDFPLARVATAVLDPFIFVNPDPRAPGWDETVGELPGILAAAPAPLAGCAAMDSPDSSGRIRKPSSRADRPGESRSNGFAGGRGLPTVGCG